MLTGSQEDLQSSQGVQARLVFLPQKATSSGKFNDGLTHKDNTQTTCARPELNLASLPRGAEAAWVKRRGTEPDTPRHPTSEPGATPHLAHRALPSGTPNIFRKKKNWQISHTTSGYVTPACPPGPVGGAKGCVPCRLPLSKCPSLPGSAHCLSCVGADTYHVIELSPRPRCSLSSWTTCCPITNRETRGLCLGVDRPPDNIGLYGTSTDKAWSPA